MDDMRARLDGLAGVDINIQAQQDGLGGGRPINIEIYNNDLGVAARATEEIIALMEEMGGFVDISDSRPSLVLNGQSKLTVMKPPVMGCRLIASAIW